MVRRSSVPGALAQVWPTVTKLKRVRETLGLRIRARLRRLVQVQRTAAQSADRLLADRGDASGRGKQERLRLSQRQ